MAVILPNVPGVIRVVHKGSLFGLPFVNTMHVQGSLGVYVQADVNAVATAMHAAYVSAFIALFSSNVHLLATDTVDLTSRTGAVGVVTEDHPGTAVGTSIISNQCAVCISWTIQDRYRGGHPRMYLPVRSASDVTNGRTLLPAYQGLVDAAASGYLTSIRNMTVGGQTWLPLCVRYFSQHQLLAVPLQRHITDSSVHTRVDSMRRRTGKETG